MDKIYKYTKNVEPHEVDYKFDMSVASMISTFQALATYHSIDLKCDYFTLKEKDNAFWVVTRVKLIIDKYPKMTDILECSTWYEQPSLIRCPRVYKLASTSGDTFVTALSEWCTLDLETFRPKKLDTVSFDMSSYVEESVNITFDKNIYEVSDADFEFDRVVRYSDLDMNMHTNNVIYSKIIMDTFSTEYLDNNTLKEFQIDYVNQSKEGETISVYQKEISSNFFFVVGNVIDKCIFRAYLKFDKVGD